jgi:hypothetical protein
MVAGGGARPRVASKLGGKLPQWTGVGDLGALREVLPPGTTLLEPEGTRSGEVWLELVRGGDRAWIVCDAFFNVAAFEPGFSGWVLRATRTGPGLSLGQTWKYLQLADRARYKAWLLERLAGGPPNVLVVAHGSVLRDVALGERLRAIVEERL